MGKKFEIEIKKVVGACEKEIFKKMLKNGDIVADKVGDACGQIVKILGYARTHISTDDKDFDMNYYAIENGYISSGSSIFLESVEDYYGDSDVEFMKITKIKTKKGTTYKAMPILNVVEKKQEIEEDIDDSLPF